MAKQIDQVMTSVELTEVEKEEKRVEILKDQARQALRDADALILRAQNRLEQVASPHASACGRLHGALHAALGKI